MMGSNNTKTPSAFNPGYRRPTAAVVETIEAPRGHDIGPPHTAQMTALANQTQFEKTTLGALEGRIKVQEKQRELLCLKISRLDRQMERARNEHDVQLLKQYAGQQELQVKKAERRKSCPILPYMPSADLFPELYERHGVEYLDESSSPLGKRQIVEVDTPDTGRSASPPKAPRRCSNLNEKLMSWPSGSKTSEEPTCERTPEPDMIELSDTTDNEL